MIAVKNEYMNVPLVQMYIRNADEIIREQRLALEESNKYAQWLKNQMKEKDNVIAEKNRIIVQLQKQLNV